MTTVLHLVANVRVLDMEIKATDEKENLAETIVAMEKCIKKHVLLLDVIEMLQKINSLAMFIQFSTMGCTICLVTFNMAMNRGDSNSVREALYVAVIVLQLFLSTYFGTMLTSEVRQNNFEL